MANKNGILSPYDFTLKKLDLITSAGNTVDLRLIYHEINLFQDIFANVMSGNISLIDSTNLSAYFTIIGNEFLHIVLDKPGLKLAIDKTFRIYSKPDTKVVKTSVNMLKLSFCSEELLVSKGVKLSKSYTQMLVSDIVRDIGKNILKIPAAQFSSANIEPTNNILDVIIPKYNPLQAINWLSYRAVSSIYTGATFLFYENNNGFMFQPLQKLMSVTKPVFTYNYNEKNTSNDPTTNFYDVQNYSIVKTPDTLENLLYGKYAGTLMTLDPLRQKFTTKYLNGDDLFNNSNTLSLGKPYNSFEDRLGNSTPTSYDSFRKFYPSSTGRNNSSYIQQRENPSGNFVDQWLMERNAQLLQLVSVRLKVLIPGNNAMQVGNIIKFNFPSNEPQSGNQSNSRKRKLDPYLSGNYLVTAMKHNITPMRFMSVVEICKDSYNNPVSPPLNNATIQGLA